MRVGLLRMSPFLGVLAFADEQRDEALITSRHRDGKHLSHHQTFNQDPNHLPS